MKTTERQTRILIVDDDPDILRGTARALDKAKYSTAEAAGVHDVLRLMPEFEPNLVLLDRDLPEVDGLEICRRIKELDNKPQPFVVLISGTFTGSDQQAEGLESGADGYLTRPIGNRELVARVDSYVRIWELSQTLREERQKLEEINQALRESEERFRATFEQAAVGIAHVALDGRLINLNQRFCDIVGYDREELLQKTFQEITYPQDLDRDMAQVQRLLAKEIEAYSLEKRYVRKDGSLVWINLTGSVMHDSSGEPKNFIGVVEDISARKDAEAEQEHLRQQLAQSQKMDSIGQLAGGVAHDFNNQLTVILGHAEGLLADMDPENPIQDSLKSIQRAGNHSAQLTKQLLAFARRQTIAPVVLDPNQTIEKMLSVLRRLMGENLELHWRPAPELWSVTIDPSQLEQILANLCVNARDAISDVGTLTIETANHQLDEEYCLVNPGFKTGPFVRLTVRDTGCGMDLDTLEKIFEPFFTTKESGRGTGLGMATVYGIVKQNDGFVKVDSSIGIGTTVEIFFPKTEGNLKTVEKNEGIKKRGSGETILIVEDEPSILEVMERMVTSLGYKALAAPTPGEAIMLAQEGNEPIHLVLTDVVMPKMNGRQMSAKMKEINPDLKCIFMSGYTANVIAHHGVLEPGVHFIEKPFSKQALAEKLAEVFDSQ